MARTTMAELEGKLGQINKQLSKRGYTHQLGINWDYGQPRVYRFDPTVSRYIIDRELSPRDTTGVVWQWLDAFENGLCFRQ